MAGRWSTVSWAFFSMSWSIGRRGSGFGMSARCLSSVITISFGRRERSHPDRPWVKTRPVHFSFVPSGAPPRAATIHDVAVRAGTSRATAARALGGYGPVNPATAARVLAAAEEGGYQANAVARSMITGRTMTLGVVVGDIENEFFSRLVRGCTDVVRASGYDVLL